MSTPPTLKTLQPFLVHAKALESIAPDVSYFCKLYCIQDGMKLRSKAPPDEQNVQKNNLGSKADDAQAYGVVLNWALKVFKLADDEDRSENANKTTAKNFLAASQFFDVAKQFGELTTEIQEKQKYAKWKAVDILSAIKRGEKPRPGGKDEMNTLDGLDQQDYNFSSIPINTSNHSSFDVDSHHNNTTNITASPSSTIHSEHNPQQPNIPVMPNFTSVDFPPIPHIPNPNPSFDIPTIPTPSFHTNTNNTQHPTSTTTTTTSSFHNNTPYFSSNNTHNLPTTQSIPSPNTSHVSSAESSASTRPNTTSSYQPNEDDVAHATKYVSALSYDDIGTAVKYLKMALFSLTGEK